MPKRIYFISSEVSPFSEASNLATFSNKIATHFQERKQDLRIFTPRYGFVSERRYVIREVIRLKEIEVPYKNDTLLGSAKSAFVPNTKVQVYFMDYAPYFGSKNKTLYTVADNRYNTRNAEKFFFFSKIALENLTYLYWQPDYIVCNDWTTALVPVMLKTIYKDEEFFADMKTVLNLVNLEEMGKVDEKHLQMAGLDPSEFKDFKDNLLGLAVHYADEVIATSIDGVDAAKQLASNKKFTKSLKSAKKDLKTFSLKEDSEESWQHLGTELETLFGVDN